jgi:hypothetical protein
VKTFITYEVKEVLRPNQSMSLLHDTLERQVKLLAGLPHARVEHTALDELATAWLLPGERKPGDPWCTVFVARIRHQVG